MKLHTSGTRLGQFEIISHPIFGDLTVDYICLDRIKLCPVQLKTLNTDLKPGQAARDCFKQIGTSWMSLGRHPNIVSCQDVIQPGGAEEIYLVLQAVMPDRGRETPSLASWLAPGEPLPVLQALLFALQIVRGMHSSEEQAPGFIHGDLKPENILVTRGRLSPADVNRICITDFGISAVLPIWFASLVESPEGKPSTVGRTQLVGGTAGTPLYMAPEMWQGGEAGKASDIYAFGCILYKMLVGRHPFGGDTNSSLKSSHCSGNVRPMPLSLPEPVIDLTTQCLSLEPGKRYQSWGELETSIESAYRHITHYPAPPSEEGPAQSERVLQGQFLDALGCASMKAGNLDMAVQCMELALKTGQDEGDRSLVASATGSLAETYRLRGDAQQAIELHRKALALAEEIHDRSLEGSAQNGLGIDHLQLGNPQRAIQHLEKALAIAREIHDRQGEMGTLGNIGNVYNQLGDLPRSRQYYEHGLELARKLGDRQGESAALSNLGLICNELGDCSHAVLYHEKALSIKIEIGDRSSQFTSLNNLANSHRDQGSASRAFEYYSQALALAREIGDRRGEAIVWNNMGATYSGLGQMEKAREYHEQALQIFREVGDRRSESDCLTNLGYIHMTRNEPERAKDVCRQALAIDREMGDTFGLALDSFNMANLLINQSCFQEALPYAVEAAEILEKVGHTLKAPQARDLVSWIHERINHPVIDIPYSGKEPDDFRARQILQVRQDNPGLTARMSDEDILVLLQQADTAVAQGRPMVFTQGPQGWQGAVYEPDPHKMSASKCGEYGDRLFEEGRFLEAEKYYQAQLEKGRKESDLEQQVAAYNSLGNVHSLQGNTPQAMTEYHQALSLAERVNNLTSIGRIYNDIGEAYRRQGDYQQAMAYYDKSLRIAAATGNEQQLAAIYGNMGIVYKNRGQFEQAISSYKRSLEYSIRLGNDRLTSNQYGNLGNVYGMLGQSALAIEMAQKSLEIYLRMGNQRGAAHEYGNLGVVQAALGNHTVAAEMYGKALTILQDLGDETGVAMTQMNLGNLYVETGKYDQSLALYGKALAVFERIGNRLNAARVHDNLGLLYHAWKQDNQARLHLQKALELFTSIGDEQSSSKVAGELKRL